MVGKLAQSHGFKVSLRPSAYGGVRAILVVPEDVISDRAGVAHFGCRAGSAGAGQRPGAEAVGTVAGIMSEHELGSEEPASRNANGLPQRRRRTPAASPFAAGAQAGRAAAAPDARSEKAAASTTEPGLRLAAFQNAVSGEPTASGSGSRDGSSEEGER
ncbi:hypothetical protein ACU686_03285 [Yinghuangia aomiensis]